MIQNSAVSTSDISRHYNELDSFYRDMWGTHLHHGLWDNKEDSKEEAVENMVREILSYLSPLEGKHLADIGCGYGESAKMAIDLGAKRVTGYTISEKQCQYARHQLADYPVSFMLRDWLENDIPDNYFDGAYSIECFEHLIDKKKYFKEIHRTLKPGAKFVMSAWLSKESPGLWEERHILKPICEEGRLPSLYNEYEVMEAFEASGLKFFDFVDLSDKVWRTWAYTSKEVIKSLLHKEGIKYLMNARNSERKFALTNFRILLGYKLKAFKYGLFVMYK